MGSISAVSGSPALDGWQRRKCVRAIRIQRLEGSLSPEWSYVFSIGLWRVMRNVELSLRAEWAVVTVDSADRCCLEAAADGGWGDLVGARVSMRRRGGVRARARGEIEVGVAVSCGT